VTYITQLFPTFADNSSGMIGQSVGNYVIQRQLGEGGMGAVYLAEHPRIGRKVAIKVLLRELSANAQAVTRFFNEARASSEIRNEHIIDVLDFGELADGSSYLVLEYLDGRTLTEALQRGPLGVRRTLHIVNGVGRALGAAHAAGIVHRDLKPDNVMLVKRGSDEEFVKVLDFGIAKLSQLGQLEPGMKTKTGALLGTPSYMSPEQCRGLPVDHRSDVYSLGVMMYQMFSGSLPFEADGLGNLLLAHMTQQPVPLAERVPGLPPHLAQVVARAMEKTPEARFQDVSEMLAAIGDPSGQYATLSGDRAAPGTSWEVPSLKSKLDTIGGNVAAEAVRRTPLPQKRGGGLWIGLATVLVIGAAGAFVWKSRAVTVPSQPRAEQPIAAAPAPKLVAPPPVEDKVPAADEVRVQVRVQPATAQLFLDDAPIANPFDGHFARSDARHKLEARAPGHKTEAQWIEFDHDRAVDLALGLAGRSPAPGVVKKQVPDDGRPVYKGTKGKLITDFPSE
jgi:eukaryotic-like serine/threonine-protein kinase